MKKLMVIGSAILTIGVFTAPLTSIKAAGSVTDGQEQAVSLDALIGDRHGDGIWTRPYGEQQANYEGDISLHAGTIVHIDKSTTYGDVTWYHIQVDGNPIGWVDSRTLDNNIPAVTSVGTDQVIAKTEGNSIWSSPYGLPGSKYIGSTNNYAGKDVKLVQQMTYNNVLWYQISVDGNVVGWIDSHALSELSDVNEVSQSAVMDETQGNGIWSMPYGLPGAEYVGNTNEYAYHDIQLVESAKKGSTQWYKVMVDGKVIGWIDAKALDTAGKTVTENQDVVIGSKSNGIWSVPYGIAGANYLGNTIDYALQHVHVTKSVKKGNVTWYQVQVNGQTIGWIDGGNAVTDEKVTDENSTETVDSSANGDSIWSLPYGEDGAQYVGPTNQFSNQPVQVVASVQKGSTIWNKIKVGNRIIGWLDSHVFQKLDNTKDENQQAVIGSANDGDGIWSLPYGFAGAQYISPVNTHSYENVKVIQSGEKKGITWYKIQLADGTTGWVDARVFNNEYDGLQNVQDENQQEAITHANGDGIWSAPYGEHNAKYLGSVDTLANQNVQILKSAKKDGITWNKIKYGNGKIGWVDARVLGSITYTASSVKEKAYSLGFFDRGDVLVYNKNGQSGDPSDDYAYLYPIGNGDTDIRLTVVNADAAFLPKLKELGADILPTGSQIIIDKLKSQLQNELGLMDGQTINQDLLDKFKNNLKNNLLLQAIVEQKLLDFKNKIQNQPMQMDGRHIYVDANLTKIDMKFGPIVK